MKRGTRMNPTMSAASKVASIALGLRAVVLRVIETIRVRDDHGSVFGVRRRWKQQSKEIVELTSRLRDPGDAVRDFYIWGDSHGFWPLTDFTPVAG